MHYSGSSTYKDKLEEALERKTTMTVEWECWCARRDGSGRFARGATGGAGLAQGRRGGSSTTQQGRAGEGKWEGPVWRKVPCEQTMVRGQWIRCGGEILCQWCTGRYANKSGLTWLNPETPAKEFSSPPIGLTSQSSVVPKIESLARLCPRPLRIGTGDYCSHPLELQSA